MSDSVQKQEQSLAEDKLVERLVLVILRGFYGSDIDALDHHGNDTRPRGTARGIIAEFASMGAADVRLDGARVADRYVDGRDSHGAASNDLVQFADHVIDLAERRLNSLIVTKDAALAEQAKEIEYLRNPNTDVDPDFRREIAAYVAGARRKGRSVDAADPIERPTAGDGIPAGAVLFSVEHQALIDSVETFRRDRNDALIAAEELRANCDAANVEIARLKAEAEAMAQRNALLVKAHKAAVYANAKLEMDPMDLDLEYAAKVIEDNKNTDAWERAVLEYVAIEDAQKEGRT